MLATLLLAYCSAETGSLPDNFDRADSSRLGNGWIEKNTATFTLSGNQAAKQSVSSGYRDNLVYRPSSEDIADVEASVEFRLLSGAPGYPQIMVRVQSASAQRTNHLDGYILYVNSSPTEAILGRQRGSAFVEVLAPVTISPALNTTDTYRLRLSATDTTPVQLSAYIERLSGGTWQTIGQATAKDSSPNRITSAGSVGFGGFSENSYRYDNFARVSLGGGQK